jgi:hypothetical protein
MCRNTTKLIVGGSSSVQVRDSSNKVFSLLSMFAMVSVESLGWGGYASSRRVCTPNLTRRRRRHLGKLIPREEAKGATIGPSGQSGAGRGATGHSNRAQTH